MRNMLASTDTFVVREICKWLHLNKNEMNDITGTVHRAVMVVDDDMYEIKVCTRKIPEPGEQQEERYYMPPFSE